MVTVAEIFALGLKQQQAGQLSLAEQTVGQALALDPCHGDCLHLMGCIQHALGRGTEAVDYFRRATEAEPAVARYHRNLGTACRVLGQWDAALRCYQQALQLEPDNPAVWNDLGVTLQAQGRTDEAITAFRTALGQQPDEPQALSNLGASLNVRQQYDEAIPYLRQAVRLRPDFPEALNGLGYALQARGQLDEAVTCFEQAARASPTFAPARVNLGNALRARGDLDGAIDAYRQAVQLQPRQANAHAHLGDAYLARKCFPEAVACYQQALAIQPGHVAALGGLGDAHYFQGRLDEAVACYRHAVRAKPDLAHARHNLGVTLQAQGKMAEARECFLEVLRRQPNHHVAHSTYVASLIYDPAADASLLLTEHRRWAGQQIPPKLDVPAHANACDPKRRLRIGYVSPDLRAHPVAYFVEPILAHHDREAVEVFAYAEVAAPDGWTARLRGLTDHWRATAGLSDAEMARLVREDQIDILVDLAGHTARNRLLVFARKPAPVQVSYLGYPCTTGVAAVDYRLGDAVTDPPDEPPGTVEELVRLASVFCCYAPPAGAPAVGPLPALRNGFVTFGSLHKLEKLNRVVLDLWCRILRALPSSRLLLARHVLQGGMAAELVGEFRKRGIDTSRIELRRPGSGDLEHLPIYQEIDMALDPFPWNGHTAACEALWMGVPVIALRGPRHSARMVASILSCLGLDELAAPDPQTYTRRAVELAGDFPRLAELRSGLRSRMNTSALCDGAAFTHELEAVYRRMWQTWCARDPGSYLRA